MKKDHLLTEVTQSAVIAHDRKILILSLTNFPSKRVFPGGRINEGEKWIDGLSRELKEEISVEKVSVKNILALDNWKAKHGNQMGIFYYCNLDSDRITLSEEHEAMRWVGIEDNLDEIDFFHPLLRELISYVLKNQDKLNNGFVAEKFGS